jgi:hypothetical protein
MDLYQCQFPYVKDSWAFEGTWCNFSVFKYEQKTLFFRRKEKMAATEESAAAIF